MNRAIYQVSARAHRALPDNTYKSPMFSTCNRKTLLVALFIMASANISLFKRLLEVYPLSLGNLPFLLSLTLFFTFSTALFLLLVAHTRGARWLLALLVLLASQAAYYMDTYGVVIDTVMIDNVFHTDAQEFAGLISMSLVLRTLLLGVLPAWLIIRYWPRGQGFKAELKSKLSLTLLLIAGMVLVVAPFTAHYASFIREHKITRNYANPIYPVYSLFGYAREKLKSSAITKLTATAPDAVMIGTPSRHELVILVVGETARADRFSLNGYPRETNPELAKRDVLSLRNVSSCGTSTGESVPCMFSALGRKEFDREKALHYENALDVLFEHGVQILWRDNNSDSKGVATRMKYENFKSPTLNKVCDTECRDIGMLGGLDHYINSHKNQDILIVLHQMGNHGPEYYRRYPPEFERYKPVCKSNELNQCTQQELDNAYDNAILYTDYFLAHVVDFLKQYNESHATAMLYVSDHGESLGEHGIYLHAAPYMIAPKEQTHVPAIVWMGQHFDYKLSDLKPYQDYHSATTTCSARCWFHTNSTAKPATANMMC